MKTPKISKMKAVAVVAVLCFMVIPTVNAGNLIRDGYVYGGDGGEDWNEYPNFPEDVPENRTSLTCICARRGWDIWNRQVYDVGFAIYVMRLRDGEPHAWNFVGSIVTRYDDENGPVQEMEYTLLDFWDGETSLRFDIVVEGVHTESKFYTKTLTGTIYTDGPVEPQTYSRTFYGWDYHNSNSNVNEAVAASAAASSGVSGSPVPR